MNTMPYLFEPEAGHTELVRFPPARAHREYQPGASLTHFEYFRLCLSAHYLTCATPVPTDVDNQIRQKLWPRQLPLETALEMAGLVLESRDWDFTLVTERYSRGAQGTPCEKDVLSGHLGEWFTVACGAYCATTQYTSLDAGRAREAILEAIAGESKRHADVFESLWKAGDGVACLKASASIAHNFGDLDRVMDMWQLDVADPLRLGFYKLGSQPFDAERKLRYRGNPWVAGELYKSVIDGGSMSFDNHRHFALRKPRAIRRKREFLIPTGPFFDDWGRAVARGLATANGKPSEDTLEVVEALSYGWKKLPNTRGYGRALRAMKEIHPELDLDSLRKNPAFAALLDTPQELFEKRWNDEALRLMSEIPSRAS